MVELEEQLIKYREHLAETERHERLIRGPLAGTGFRPVADQGSRRSGRRPGDAPLRPQPAGRDASTWERIMRARMLGTNQPG